MPIALETASTEDLIEMLALPLARSRRSPPRSSDSSLRPPPVLLSPARLVLQDFKHRNAATLERHFGATLGLAYGALFELERRARAVPPPPKFESAANVYAWAKDRLGPLEHEELWSLSLTRAGRLLSAQRLAQGGSASLSIPTRDILRVALRDGAHGLLLVHNHPSGEVIPSEEDRWFTTSVQAAANVVGLSLLDHVVVSSEGYWSMRESGQMA
jgi:DNA repair protein RadC